MNRRNGQINLLVGLFIIFYNQFNYGTAKPMVGQNVRESMESEFPFIVSLYRFSSEPLETTHMCTGTLYSRRDVLTADHCIKNEEMKNVRVIVGSNNLMSGMHYSVLFWITYNEWADENIESKDYIKNDLAVIKLVDSVPPYVTPAAFSTMSNTYLYGLEVTTAGWSQSMTYEVSMMMKTVNLKVLSIRECENRILTIYGTKPSLDQRLLCTHAEPFAILTYGDSGGPLLYNNKIVAVNSGTCLYRDDDFHPQKINLHFGIEYYKNFLIDVKNNY